MKLTERKIHYLTKADDGGCICTYTRSSGIESEIQELIDHDMLQMTDSSASPYGHDLRRAILKITKKGRAVLAASKL